MHLLSYLKVMITGNQYKHDPVVTKILLCSQIFAYCQHAWKYRIWFAAEWYSKQMCTYLAEEPFSPPGEQYECDCL